MKSGRNPYFEKKVEIEILNSNLRKFLFLGGNVNKNYAYLRFLGS